MKNRLYYTFFSFVLISVAFFSCSKKEEVCIKETEIITIPAPTKDELQQKSIDNFIATMTLEEKIAQMFLIAVDGTDASNSAITYDIPPGGFVLFEYNTSDGAESLIDLIGETKVHYARQNSIIPFFSIDHEGGYVHRLRDIASPLASAASTAKFLSPELAYELYSYHAQQLESLGIDVNLGPMAEVSYPTNELFTKTRSFGSEEKVIEYGNIFLDAFNDNNIYCVLKHFPGNTNDDPHFTLPVLEGSVDEINDLYIDSFKKLINNQGVLMSHAIVSAFDSENPACLSKEIIRNVLIADLQFDGLVFSDELLMDALEKNGFPPEKAIPMAINAGVNLLMIADSEYWHLVELVRDCTITNSELRINIDKSVEKILKAKIDMDFYSIIHETLETVELVQTENTSLYNKEKQVQDFNVAKQKGEDLYYTYWARK